MVSSKRSVDSWNAALNQDLGEYDPEIHDLIEKEKKRQRECLELIASENLTSKAVIDALGSPLTNKYSEGLPGARYYAGNEHIDSIERLCQSRALAAFSLDPNVWGVNVQPYSGSPANFAVYTAFLKPHDRIMGLDLPSGGHLTHGFQTAKKKISATSVYFESMPYQVNSEGYIDYESLATNARLFRPKMIICGASAYPRDWDFGKLREIANEHGAWLFADIAHVSGLVCTGFLSSPFEHCDVVTTTTHKTLRGPRSAMIFVKKGAMVDGVEAFSALNQAVFPGLQGGPHNHQIAAMAVALKQAASPEFKAYGDMVIKNAKALAEALIKRGYKIATNGTDNHVVLWDLRPNKLTGSKMETVCELANMTLNKNCVPGDKSALSPGGVRIGTAALTSRSVREADMEKLADMLDRAVKIAVTVQESTGSRLMKDFNAALPNFKADTDALREDVTSFAVSLPIPGF